MGGARVRMAIDDLLDEHEQSERVRTWLRKNGLSIIGGDNERWRFRVASLATFFVSALVGAALVRFGPPAGLAAALVVTDPNRSPARRGSVPARWKNSRSIE